MANMPSPGTKTYVKIETSISKGWKVILFDDDVTPFDIVIYGIQRAAGLSEEVADMIANEAHLSGQALVLSGLSEADAEMTCASLRRWTTVPNLCTGVSCEAMLDDG